MVARVDASQMRLFVAAADVTEQQIVGRVRDLEACFVQTEWTSRWSLSVFSDPALVGYKDDPHLASFHENGEWAKAYLAEYSAASGQLTMQPASAFPRTITVRSAAGRPGG
jgi:hypothetical protein